MHTTRTKKLLLTLVLAVAASATLSAQEFRRRGIALGADRDTLDYIIASPFDNWWLNVSGGVQTYIGNTPDPEAYWNKVDPGLRIEVGKWVIPDLAFSLRFDAFHASSQTRHAGNNPWIDYSKPLNYDGAEYGPYYPMSVHGISLMGGAMLDWTNLFSGYQNGKRKHWHVYTPVNLGVVWLHGKTINQNYVNKTAANQKPVEMGDRVWNKELCASAGVTLEWLASKHVSFNLTADAKLARGSLDDHNYDVRDNGRHVDWMPGAYLGAKVNLFRSMTKYHPYSKTSSREKINHEFLTRGSRNTISNLEGRISVLNNEIGALQDKADKQSAADKAKIDSLNYLLGDLQYRYDSVLGSLERMPVNVFEELSIVNEVLELPAVIVYFHLDRYDLDYNGRKRLQNFASRVNELPDTVEYFLIGAADSATGSIPHNQWLSEHRCETARNLLVNHFGVSNNQLQVEPMGGITVYEENEDNRMVMLIMRTKDTEEIVERWKNHMK